MLTHLQTTYGTITRAKLEANQASIATLWSPTDPIKLLWECLHEVQHIATVRGDPITNQAIIDLTFLLLESTGVFTMSCDMWRICPAANKTLTEFHVFFTTENKECLRKLTTGQGGFHRANAATILGNKPAPPPHSKATAPTTTTQTASPATITTNDGISMYYCWTHRLGSNKTHTSTTCSNLADSHCLTATVKNMQGRNNTIMSDRHRPKVEATKME